MKDGLIIIDKPAGWTSHDVVARLRKILKTKKIGHTGTLDPFATGVLVMLVGKATRLARFLHSDEKEYEAVMRFGYETDTGDASGEPRLSDKLKFVGPRYDRLQPVEDSEENDEDSPRSRAAQTEVHGTARCDRLQLVESLSKGLIDAVLPEFLGQIEQVPPMYSAKKVEGKRLYKMAREGIEIERDPVKVTIGEIECTGEITSGEGTKDFGLRVACSAGTYVRTLAEDIGRRVGVGCHLAELRRTRAGRFTLESARTLDDLAKLDPSDIDLLPMNEAVAHLPSIDLSLSEEEEVRHGRRFANSKENLPERGEIALFTSEGDLAAVGVYDPDTGEISPKLVMI
ncbi:MAG: tRNA pseudouridine(55) synthase TruB [Acidobacteriota bacterium]|nr:MAG: tRNA pseudouridine(55) synthase TruB [Acidobacteriota bacterium]